MHLKIKSRFEKRIRYIGNHRCLTAYGHFHKPLYIKHTIFDVAFDLFGCEFVKFPGVFQQLDDAVFLVQDVLVKFGITIEKELDESSGVGQCSLAPSVDAHCAKQTKRCGL